MAVAAVNLLHQDSVAMQIIAMVDEYTATD
jgi:hypothetical protein